MCSAREEAGLGHLVASCPSQGTARRPWGCHLAQGLPLCSVSQPSPAPAPAGQACTAVGLPVWAYPLGAQVLHGRVSLEESEQALGGGWCLLCTAPWEATEGRGRAGGLMETARRQSPPKSLPLQEKVAFAKRMTIEVARPLPGGMTGETVAAMSTQSRPAAPVHPVSAPGTPP